MLCSCPRPPLQKRPRGPLPGKQGNQRPLGHKETRPALFESEPQTGQETGGRQGDWEGVRDRPRGGKERQGCRGLGDGRNVGRGRERPGRVCGEAGLAGAGVGVRWAAPPGPRYLGRATWAGLTGLRGGRRQSRAWLPRTVFVPRRSAFLWAGGAPCRPRRVARQSAQPRPRKARLGPARPLSPAGEAEAQRRDSGAGAAPGPRPSPRLVVRTRLPPGGRPEARGGRAWAPPWETSRPSCPAHGLRAGLAWPRGRRAAPP